MVHTHKLECLVQNWIAVFKVQVQVSFSLSPDDIVWTILAFVAKRRVRSHCQEPVLRQNIVLLSSRSRSQV